MKTKANISIDYANDLLAHISNDKKLTKQEIINRTLDIRDNLIKILEYIRKEEELKIKSKSVKDALLERLTFKREQDTNLEIYALKSAIDIRMMESVLMPMKQELEELRAFKEKHLKAEMETFG